MCEAALLAVQFRGLHMWNLLKIKNNALKMSERDYESKCRLHDASHIELKWWIKNVSYKNRINTSPRSATIYSDACPTGWGAACGNLSTGVNWSIAESQRHINYLEMLAALLALRLYCKDLQDLTVFFKTDNTSTVSWVNKESGPDKEIFTLVKQFWEFCIDRNINVVASYIESKKNKVADKESRKIRDNLEWSLKDKHFENLNIEFGKFTIDVFATRINSKCRRYYSYSPEPEAAGTDASYATGIRKTSMHFLLLV